MNDTTAINKIYRMESDIPLTPEQIIIESEIDFSIRGYVGDSEYTKADYLSDVLTITSYNCENGCEYELLPKDDPAVIVSGKLWMQCRVCHKSNHL